MHLKHLWLYNDDDDGDDFSMILLQHHLAQNTHLGLKFNSLELGLFIQLFLLF